MNRTLDQKIADLKMRCDDMECELTMLKQLLDMREYALRDDYLCLLSDVFDHPLKVMAESLAASVSDIKLVFKEEFSDSNGLD